MMYRLNRIKINSDWRFRFETDSEWETVDLPHSWNALDTMSTDPDWYYRRGTGIYEKDFEPLDSYKGQTVWLEFEAVSQKAKVYFDGDLLTEHWGGYTAFKVAIPNRKGTLRIEADNSPDPNLVPSDMSDFYLYGGITRNVWLYTTKDTYIDSILCDIDTTLERGIVTVRAQIAGNISPDMRLSITIEPIQKPSNIAPIEEILITSDFQITLPTIDGDDFHLWSPDKPNRYMLTVTIHHNNQLIDSVSEIIGFRSFEFPEYGAFYLNGERLLLRGTHRHEDWAGYGSAVPDEITRKEFQMIKDAGFNFVRLGHYPQSRAALEACDELGIIVWEEIPWCRGGIGGEDFKAYTRQMLQEMITQHYNHPSIIFWGLGNELDWESEHSESTDDKVCEFLQELHEFAHILDSSRLTALRRFDYGADIVDVYSPSIWAGWYRGKYTDYEQNLRDAMAKFPRFLHAEWGGDSHVGRYRQAPHISEEPISTVDNAEEVGTATSDEGFTRYSKDGDWSETYILNLMNHHLMVQNKLDNLAGTLQWAFKDFGTPLRPENPVPYVNQKGLLDRAGRPKDNYHLFKAWQVDPTLKNQPMIIEESCTSAVENTDFKIEVRDKRIEVTLYHDNENCIVTTDERRVRFILLEGGILNKYQGYMGGSDVVETANGRAWVAFVPDLAVTSLKIAVKVEGIGEKVEIIQADYL
ncbi:MAG: glycoside hydrolase family 2 TIM barrel-domain containing protein [Phototrophicaceae bacterium]